MKLNTQLSSILAKISGKCGGRVGCEMDAFSLKRVWDIWRNDEGGKSTLWRLGSVYQVGAIGEFSKMFVFGVFMLACAMLDYVVSGSNLWLWFLVGLGLKEKERGRWRCLCGQ